MRKVLTFFLLLFPDLAFTDIIQRWIIPIIIVNPFLYFLFFWALWLLSTLILTILYYAIMRRIKWEWVRFVFRIVVTIVLIISLPFILTEMIAGHVPWRYPGCGEEFNKVYFIAAKKKDLSFCYDLEKYTINSIGGKGGTFCILPSGDALNLKRGYPMRMIGDCVSSLAKYTNDINLCLRLKDLPAEGDMDNATDIYHPYEECVKDYAVAKKDLEACDLLLNSDSKYGKKWWWEGCRKRVCR